MKERTNRRDSYKNSLYGMNPFVFNKKDYLCIGNPRKAIRNLVTFGECECEEQVMGGIPTIFLLFLL